MRIINFARRATTLGAAAAASLLGFLLFPSSAFALFGPVGGGSSPAVRPETTPSTTHNIVTGGTAGWQITLIAVAAAPELHTKSWGCPPRRSTTAKREQLFETPASGGSCEARYVSSILTAASRNIIDSVTRA